MPDPRPSPRPEPLADTLDAIRTALQQGDYAALPALSDRAESQLHALAAASPTQLHALRARADATGLCLAAAARGFRAAEQRLAALRAGGLSTYDPQGRRRTLTTALGQTRRY